MTNESFQVREWMRKARQATPDSPTVPSLEERILCAKLQLEECMEMIEDGLGLNILAKVNNGYVHLSGVVYDFDFVESGIPSLVHLADGLGDTKYVANYIAIKHGIDMEPVEAEIQRSNNTKFQWSAKELGEAAEKGWTIQEIGTNEYCVTDKSGKIRKSNSYSPADIKTVLHAQSDEGQKALPSFDDVAGIYNK